MHESHLFLKPGKLASLVEALPRDAVLMRRKVEEKGASRRPALTTRPKDEVGCPQQGDGGRVVENVLVAVPCCPRNESLKLQKECAGRA